jgi:phosphoribosyl-dephospho-CoA transferase
MSMPCAAHAIVGDVRVHDLLRLRDPGALRWDGAAPAWVRDALGAAPWVVVRRAAARGAWLAVGVRGSARAQRAAAWLDAAGVLCLREPPALRARAGLLAPARAQLPVFAALRSLERAWREHGPMHWGPGGSVGFELASGVATAGPHSDLDVVVRCERAPSTARARAWLRALPHDAPARIDVLLEWPAGGAALAEFAAGGPYLLRTRLGARLRRAGTRPVGVGSVAEEAA